MTRSDFEAACRGLLSALGALLTDLDAVAGGAAWRAELAPLVDDLTTSLSRDDRNERRLEIADAIKRSLSGMAKHDLELTSLEQARARIHVFQESRYGGYKDGRVPERG